MNDTELLLDYAHRLSEARELLKSFVDDEKLSIYRQAVLDCINMLQDNREKGNS